MFFAMRTNARMNRFEHRKDLSNAPQLAHTYTRVYVCMHLSLHPSVYSVVTTCPHGRKYVLFIALRAPCLALFVRAVTFLHDTNN